MTTAQRIVRKYHIEAMSNGYSIRILDDEADRDSDHTIAHYVVGGQRAGTKPETLRKKLIGYALGELQEQLEKAIEEADNTRPELELSAAPPADTEG